MEAAGDALVQMISYAQRRVSIVAAGKDDSGLSEPFRNISEPFANVLKL
jgi:hypothetical protein